MGFLSSITDIAKKAFKATNPMTWSVGGFSARTIAEQAVLSKVPAPLQSFAAPLVSAGSAKLFGSSVVGLGSGSSPVATPGAGLVARRNTTRRSSLAQRLTSRSTGVPTLSFSQAIQENIRRRQGSTAPTLAPVSRKDLGYPTRDIIASPGGRTLAPSATVRPAMAALPALRAIPGVIRTVTGKVSRIVSPEGRSFSRKQVASFVRRFGPEAAAAALGVTVADVLSTMLDETTTRRRRRGITARDLQTTRRTICKVKNMNKMISGTPVRRRTCK